MGSVGLCADPVSSFQEGQPKYIVGFCGQIQNLHAGYEGGSRIFHVGFTVLQVVIGFSIEFWKQTQIRRGN